MSDAMKLKDDTFSAYDDTYDVVIHCETEEEQKKVIDLFLPVRDCECHCKVLMEG